MVYDQRGLMFRRFKGYVVAHEFDPQKQTHAAHIPDQRMVACHIAKFLKQIVAGNLGLGVDASDHVVYHLDAMLAQAAVAELDGIDPGIARPAAKAACSRATPSYAPIAPPAARN